MKNLILFTIAFMQICLSSEAQFSFVKAGEPSPYDSGVVIDLPYYRAIRNKVNFADKFIQSLKKENDSLRAELNLYYVLSNKFDNLQSAQEESNVENKKAFAQLNKSFDKLLAEANKPDKWYQRKWARITRNMLLVTGGIYTGYKLAK